MRISRSEIISEYWCKVNVNYIITITGRGCLCSRKKQPQACGVKGLIRTI